MLLLVLLSRFSRVRLLCDRIDGSPPGSAVPGILQARTLEWVAMPFSRESSPTQGSNLHLLVLLCCRQILYRWATEVCTFFTVKWKWKSLSGGWRFPTLYSLWNSPGQNTGVGSLSLLQGIFPTQGSNQVSHIAGGFFSSWATREALVSGSV